MLSRTDHSGVTGHEAFKGINMHYIIQIAGDGRCYPASPPSYLWSSLALLTLLLYSQVLCLITLIVLAAQLHRDQTVLQSLEELL